MVVIGGQQPGAHGTGMTGAAVLAARAALRAGAGRVYLGLLGPAPAPGAAAATACAPSASRPDTAAATPTAAPLPFDPLQPELMLRPAAALLHDDVMDHSAVRRGMPTAHVALAHEHDTANWAGDGAELA